MRRQGPLARITSPLIGLAAEAIGSRNSPASQDTSRGQPSRPNQQPQYGIDGNPPPYEDEYSSDDEVDDILDLDEAAQSVTQRRPRPPAGNLAGPALVDTLVASFVQQNPPNLNYRGGRLQLPVILPQRRPQSKARGFVHAYAPMLMDCNISQDAFMQFLDYFDEAIKVSPVFTVINIAAGVAGFIPTPAAQAVSAAVGIADMAAKEVYTRARTNSFIDKMNEAFWKPNGLFCMVMSYKPESKNVVESVDLNSLVSKAVEPATSQSMFAKLSVSKGKTQGEINMPEPAPLVFPALDGAPEEQKKGFMPFVQDYFDRRSQAKWAQENPNSQLAMNPQFASRYADPTASVGTQGLRGMIRSNIRGQDAQPTRRQARRERRHEQRGERRGQSSRGTRQGPGGRIRNLLKQDALYLMIVNLPTSAESREVEAFMGQQLGAGY